MKIILVHPQIPQNTGNIVRTCAVTGANLILVKPLGFSIDDRWLKRAGLDYWEGVNVTLLEEEEFIKELELKQSGFYFFSSKGKQYHSDQVYTKDDWLIFGSETTGLPKQYQEKWPDNFVKIPMKEGVRCLNLATSAGIGLYEAFRQVNYSF